MTYEQAVQRLLWLGHEGRSLKWDLNYIRAVLDRLGRPERRFAGVHIAGTNGKGSVAAMLESILRAAGYRTGLYTSPHLERINERIAVAGRPCSDEDFAAAFDAVNEAVEALLAENVLPNYPSYFETLTAMAFFHFARAGVELAVVEVGLGGRLDATNVFLPEVAVITAVDFDHERYLGSSIEAIAGEKAGILKRGVPVVSAAADPVARRVVAGRAQAVGAPLTDAEAECSLADIRAEDLGRHQFTLCGPEGFSLPVALNLRGAFQMENARTAAVAARKLAARGWRIPPDAIATGLAHTEWPGRLELVRASSTSVREETRMVFFDGAHNPAGARQVARFWQDHLAGRRIHVVYGTVRDKAVEEVAELLFPRATQVIVTEPPTPRAAGAAMLARVASMSNPRVVVEPDPGRALERALAAAGPEDVVFVTGSLFLVGDCRRNLARLHEVGAPRRPVPAAASPAPTGPPA